MVEENTKGDLSPDHKCGDTFPAESELARSRGVEIRLPGSFVGKEKERNCFLWLAVLFGDMEFWRLVAAEEDDDEADEAEYPRAITISRNAWLHFS